MVILITVCQQPVNITDIVEGIALCQPFWNKTLNFVKIPSLFLVHSLCELRSFDTPFAFLSLSDCFLLLF